ncbi:GyrI-like domain-containing protein [Legionella israelensis]|nr:GyrI-like domain-containing protein [Legionella israelensis]QBS09006.1 GyrI-like domain-containing protein [Legionella israelensis]
MAEIKLIASKCDMSFSENKTDKLWRSFSPTIKNIPNKKNNFKYSVQIFPDTNFFKDFDPTTTFQKYAAIEADISENLPEKLEVLTIPAGLYAIFTYIGKPSEAEKTFYYIYYQWLKESGFELDERPHFAIMGDKYIGEHPDSEEELFICSSSNLI